MKETVRPPLLTEQEVASQLDAVARIRRGLAQARKGMGRPADAVFDDLGTRRCLLAQPEGRVEARLLRKWRR
jgi:hypothetical protein